MVWGADDKAATFLFVRPEVSVIGADQKTRQAVKGMTLRSSETIRTGGRGYAQLLFSDGNRIVVKGGTELRLDAYRYQEQGGADNRMEFSLRQGGFRSITGQIARERPQNYLVNTTAGVIGVRGTDHEPFFVPRPAAGEDSPSKPGLYDKVNQGTVILRNDSGEISISAGETGYIAAFDSIPVILPELPKIYTFFSGRRETEMQTLEEHREEARTSEDEYETQTQHETQSHDTKEQQDAADPPPGREHEAVQEENPDASWHEGGGQAQETYDGAPDGQYEKDNFDEAPRNETFDASGGEDLNPPREEDFDTPPDENIGPPPGEEFEAPREEDFNAPPDENIGPPPGEEFDMPREEDFGAPPGEDTGPPPREDFDMPENDLDMPLGEEFGGAGPEDFDTAPPPPSDSALPPPPPPENPENFDTAPPPAPENEIQNEENMQGRTEESMMEETQSMEEQEREEQVVSDTEIIVEETVLTEEVIITEEIILDETGGSTVSSQ